MKEEGTETKSPGVGEPSLPHPAGKSPGAKKTCIITLQANIRGRHMEDENDICVYCNEQKEIVFMTIFDESQRLKLLETVCLDCIGATEVMMEVKLTDE